MRTPSATRLAAVVLALAVAGATHIAEAGAKVVDLPAGPLNHHWTKNQHVDARVKPQRPDLVASALVPDYALGPHTASLGLAWSARNTVSPRFARGMFVGQHGSWNRRPRSGYKVIFLPFADGRPSGVPIDVLTGFVKPNGDAYGRPVGVAIDSRGALLVADDVGNTIWRVSRSAGKTATAQDRR
jgi:glucose/arabinose dehydrogenase